MEAKLFTQPVKFSHSLALHETPALCSGVQQLAPLATAVACYNKNPDGKDRNCYKICTKQYNANVGLVSNLVNLLKVLSINR